MATQSRAKTQTPIQTRPGTSAAALQGQRFLASVRQEGGERPHPAAVELSKQSRAATRSNRRFTEFLRINRGREV